MCKFCIAAKIFFPPFRECLRHDMLYSQIVHLHNLLMLKTLLQRCKNELGLLLSVTATIKFCCHKSLLKLYIFRIALYWKIIFQSVYYMLSVISRYVSVSGTKGLVECVCLVVADKPSDEIILYHVNYLTELFLSYCAMVVFAIEIKYERISGCHFYPVKTFKSHLNIFISDIFRVFHIAIEYAIFTERSKIFYCVFCCHFVFECIIDICLANSPTMAHHVVSNEFRKIVTKIFLHWLPQLRVNIFLLWNMYAHEEIILY